MKMIMKASSEMRMTLKKEGLLAAIVRIIAVNIVIIVAINKKNEKFVRTR